MVAGRAILAVPHPRWPSWDAHLLPAAPFSPECKGMGTDGDGRRHHLQTWMAQLNPNCIRATRGAGQDLTWESSGKGACPEPGWRRENAKPLRTATLPDGAKGPRRTPDCRHSRRGEERRGWPTGGGWDCAVQHPTAGSREPIRDDPAVERSPRPRPPPAAPLPRSKSQHRGPVEPRSGP